MARIPLADADQIVAPSSPAYDPFDPPAHNPDRRYCADRALWEVYKASLALKASEERNRCREIVRASAEAAPANLRHTLLDIIRRIDDQPFRSAR